MSINVIPRSSRPNARTYRYFRLPYVLAHRLRQTRRFKICEKGFGVKPPPPAHPPWGGQRVHFSRTLVRTFDRILAY